MAMTLASSTSLFCPVAEFLKRVDKAAVAKLASDSSVGTPVPDGSLATDPNILAALRDASGLFESAAMMGAKYVKADLELLLATDCNSRGIMYRIITDFAWTFLFERRPNMNVQAPPSMQRSLEWMELLSQGKRIFAFVETQEATVMERVEASASDVAARNGVIEQARDYFGRTADNRWQ